jgi:integrase
LFFCRYRSLWRTVGQHPQPHEIIREPIPFLMSLYHQKRKDPDTGKIVENPIYYGAYTLPWETRVRRTISLKTTDRRIAEKRLREFLRVQELTHENMAVDVTLWGAPSQALDGLLNKYAASLRAQSRTPKYVRDIYARISLLMHECKWVNIEDVTAPSFERWRSSGPVGLRSHKPLSAKSLKEYQVSMNAFFTWLRDMGIVSVNPLERVPMVETRGKETESRRAWTEKELGLFMANAPESSRKSHIDYRSTVFILYMTGLRREELQKLLWGDLHLDEKAPYLIVRAKNSKNHLCQPVSLLPEAANYFRQLRPANPETTEPVIPYKIPRSRALQRDLEALGIAFRNEFGKMDFHSLRHSCATMLARYGVAPNVAQQILRHHDVRLTLATYTHTNGEAISSELTKVPRQLDICTTHYTPHVVLEGHSAALDGKSEVSAEASQPTDSAAFSPDLSANDTARQKGKMVGVTGFEPATATSRT